MSGYCKVLILDDEFIMRQGIKHMMDWEKEGFQIVGEASDGKEGLRLTEELHPHIILADIVMPIMDGIEFSEIIGKKYPEIQLIILSSYDKFEYVKTTLLNGAADYILKPTLNPDNLLKTLKKAAERIPGFQLNAGGGEISYTSQMERVIMGFKDRLDEAVFGELFPNTLYRLAAVNIKDCCQGVKNEIFTAKRMMEEYFAEKEDYASLTVFLHEEMCCSILNYRIKDDGKVIEDVDEIAGKIRRLHPTAFFVVSRNFSDMQKIRGIYQEDILPETGKGFYCPEKYLKVIDGKRPDTVQPKRFEYETYTRRLAAGEYGEALAMLDTYIRYICECELEPVKVKNLAKNLLYNYLMETEKASLKGEESKEVFFREIDEAQWITEFWEVIGTIVKTLKSFLEDSGQDAVIRAIKAYVEAHYQESLELSDIAAKFNFSYNYLSSYFSQNVKEGFNEYLNKIRIRHAAEYLKESSFSIASIGEMVGYTEHSYFCRVFKKMMSETPSAYRKKMKRR